MDFIHITVIDIIDIVLVAMIMFYLYKLLKGTNATNIIMGIVLVYLIWVVVKALNMELLSAILGSIINVGIIALIIIFQPEIRRFLQTIGRRESLISKLLNLWHDKSAPQDDFITPVVNACGDMSSSRTGALIVIKQEGDLQEIIDTGVAIDGIISSSLLRNLFFKNSPLHDGAVIIAGNRIVAATCVLPSTQTEVPLSFGMRHRAALGISEISDAIVIVVSEETGSISIVHNGKINSGLSTTELKAELMRINKTGA